MANKNNSKIKPNQRLRKLRSALKSAIVAIDKIKSIDSEHDKEDEILFHIAFYIRQLHHRGVHFIHSHGLTYY